MRIWSNGTMIKLDAIGVFLEILSQKAPWFSEKAAGWLLKNIKREARRNGLSGKKYGNY